MKRKQDNKNILWTIIVLLLIYNFYLLFNLYSPSEQYFKYDPLPKNGEERTVFIYEAAPGTVISDSLSFDNSTNVKYDVSLDIVESFQAETGQFKHKSSDDIKENIALWTKFDGDKNIEITSGSKHKSDFFISIPDQTINRTEYRGAITITRNNISAQEGDKKVLFKEAIPVIIYISTETDSVQYLTEEKN